MYIRSLRDESFVEFALKMLVQVLINFSMGLIMVSAVALQYESSRTLLGFRIISLLTAYYRYVYYSNPSCNVPFFSQAFFIFVFGLWTIVRSYQPNPITAVIYFVSAVCAAFAFVSSYLLMLYGAAAGTIYGAAKLAESQRRLEGGEGGYRQQRVQYGGGGRPHWQ